MFVRLSRQGILQYSNVILSMIVATKTNNMYNNILFMDVLDYIWRITTSINNEMQAIVK